METLKELIGIATKTKVDNIEILGIPREKNTKAYQLYEGIVKGIFTTDDEAALFFYGKGAEHQSYLNLKYQLRKKLLNTILLIDSTPENFKEYQRLQYSVQKKWAAINILLFQKAYTASIPLIKILLQQSLKVEMTDISIEILRNLRYYYGIHKKDEDLFNQYDLLLNKQLTLRTKELLVEGLYLRLTANYIDQKHSKGDLIDLSSEYTKKIKGFVDTESGSTSKILLYSGLIEITSHLNTYDFQAVIRVCDLVLPKLLSKSLVKTPAVIAFLSQKIVCLTQLKEYGRGKAAIAELFQYLGEGNFNWFKGQEMKMYLLMHTKNYQEAFEVYNEVSAHRQFKKVLSQANQETWKIFKAYLHLLKELAIIEIPATDKNFKNFRIQRFLNDVPVFSKDKQGANIAILVIQIVFSIQQKKYDRMIDRAEAIAKYATRHIKKDDNFRSNIFIKILLELPKAAFHKAGVERGVEKYWKRLSEVPLEVASQTHSIEVIPYEDLWPLVLGMLENVRRWGQR